MFCSPFSCFVNATSSFVPQAASLWIPPTAANLESILRFVLRFGNPQRTIPARGTVRTTINTNRVACQWREPLKSKASATTCMPFTYGERSYSEFAWRGSDVACHCTRRQLLGINRLAECAWLTCSRTSPYSLVFPLQSPDAPPRLSSYKHLSPK